MDVGVKDTTAYKIIRQIVDHTWGADSKVEDEDFLTIFSSFYDRGGSWERLMDGDMKSVRFLEESIDSFFHAKQLTKVARVLAGLPPVQ